MNKSPHSWPKGTGANVAWFVVGLSPYTFERLHALRATGKVTFIAERAVSITATEVKTKSHTLKLAHPAIDATGFDISKSIAGQLFNFQDGVRTRHNQLPWEQH